MCLQIHFGWHWLLSMTMGYLCLILLKRRCNMQNQNFSMSILTSICDYINKTWRLASSWSECIAILKITHDDAVLDLSVVIYIRSAKEAKIVNLFKVIKNRLGHVIIVSSINSIAVMLSNFKRDMPPQQIRNCTLGIMGKVKTINQLLIKLKQW